LQPVNTQTLKQIIDNQIKENQMEIQINKAVTREAAIRALTDENKSNREAEFVISTEAIAWNGFKMADGI
jgi:hypothetical protein